MHKIISILSRLLRGILVPIQPLPLSGVSLGKQVAKVFKQEIMRNRQPVRAAFSLAIGGFWGFFPIYGFQVILLMGLSVILPINRPLALLSVYISNPLTYPLIIPAAIWAGKIVVPGSWTAPFIARHFQLMAHAVDWFFGSIILAFVFAILCFSLSYPILLQLNARHRNKLCRLSPPR